MSSTEKKFLADSMLGRLAKWLRVMGFDTHYRPFYNENTIARIVLDGFILLSRNRKRICRYPHSMLILSDTVEGQLQEMRNIGYIPSPGSKWFTRCLQCNHLLRAVHVEDARENIPEYIYHMNIKEIRFCPSCARYYWPGSHRHRMIDQLKKWGFESEEISPR